MNNVAIKICGVRDPDLAQKAVQAGADFIGMVFHPKSKRYVEIQTAKNISLTTTKNGAIPVAVFVDHTAEEMLEICEATHIQVVQLHGDLARRSHHLLPYHFQRIYVFPVASNGCVKNDSESGVEYLNPKRDFLLFDHEQPGQGNSFNWEKFKYDHSFCWFLAGGLNAENVGFALNQVKPNGVDVSSGIEDLQGIKSIRLIENFIKVVKKNEYR